MYTITFSEYLGKNHFCTLNSINDANLALKSIIKRKNWSDIAYQITFKNGDTFNGSIDLEPYSFHAKHINSIFKNHVKTVLGNLSKLTVGKYGISQEEIDYCKDLINRLSL